MDLGLKNKWAIICGASSGLGFACAEALAAEGMNMVIAARSEERLQASANYLKQKYGTQIITVVADVSKDQGRELILSAVTSPDVLVTNAGGPPMGDFMDVTKEQWQQALNTNMLAPIEMIRSVVTGMVSRGFGRIVNITSMSVKEPVNTICLSNGARAGLTGAVATLARQVAKHNVTVNNLLPGRFATERLKSNNKYRASQDNLDLQDIESQLISGIPAGRFGEPSEFGHACAFLCSAHAGYITGQNWLIDGGSHKGLL